MAFFFLPPFFPNLISSSPFSSPHFSHLLLLPAPSSPTSLLPCPSLTYSDLTSYCIHVHLHQHSQVIVDVVKETGNGKRKTAAKCYLPETFFKVSLHSIHQQGDHNLKSNTTSFRYNLKEKLKESFS